MSAEAPSATGACSPNCVAIDIKQQGVDLQTQSKLAALKPGAIVEAQVAAQNNPSTNEAVKGIHILDEFIPVKLPVELKAGENIKLQVVEQGEKLTLKIISKEQAAEATTDLSTSIKNIVKALNISEKQLEQIQVAAQSLKQVLSGNVKACECQSKEALELMFNLVNSSQVLQEQMLAKPEQIMQVLLKSQGKEALQTSKEALKVLDRVFQDSLSNNYSANTREIEAQIKLVLDVLGKQGAQELKETADSKTQKLLQLLQGEQTNTEKGSEKSLANFVKEHLAFVKNIESHIKQVLFLSPSYDNLELLTKTLADVNLNPKGEVSAVDKEFVEFVRQLKEDLNVAKQSPEASKAIQLVLERAFENLHLRFSQKTDNTELTEHHFQPASELSRKNQVALKSIEAQLRTILSAPETTLTKDSDITATLQTLLNSLKEVDSSNIDNSSGLDKKFLEFVQELKAALIKGQELNLSSVQLKDLVAKYLEVIHKSFSEQNIGQLSQAYQGPLESIRNLIKEILNASGPSLKGSEAFEAPGLHKEFIAPSEVGGHQKIANTIVKNEEFIALIKLLKNVKAPAEGASKADLQFFSFVSQLRQDLEGAINQSSPMSNNFIRDVLQQALDKLPGKEAASKGALHKGLKQTKELEAFRKMENVLRGQEMLQHLNPVMQSLGEPVMILFPSLFQGFLSQIEVSVYPAMKEVDEESDKRKNKTKSGFERIHMKITMPAMGEFEIDLAHRPKELLLNLSCERKEVADFVANKIGRLEKIFKAFDFENTDISVSVAKPGDTRPQWLQALTRPDSVVA